MLTANHFQESQLIEALRSTNYNLDQAAIILLEQENSETVSSTSVSISELQNCSKSSSLPLNTPTRNVAPSSFQSPKPTHEDALPEQIVETLTDSSTFRKPQTKVSLSESKKLTYQKAEERTQHQALQHESSKTDKVRINLIVVGHVDAGKSTIMGHLLFQLGYVSRKLMHKYEKESKQAGKSSFLYAWVTDADEEEVFHTTISHIRNLIIVCSAFEESQWTLASSTLRLPQNTSHYSTLPATATLFQR